MNQDPQRLGLCCIANPLDPNVWSRTPLNLAEAFSRRERLGPALFGLPQHDIKVKLLKLATAIRYANLRSHRSMMSAKAIRKRQSSHIREQIASHELQHILHFAGDHYLPLRPEPGRYKQYLYLDCTWADRAMPPHLSRRYVRDVDSAMRDAYHEMSLLFTTSEFCKRSLIDHYHVDEHRISVVGTGRGSIKPFYGKKRHSEGIILFVAKERFEEKGGALLISAFRIARRHNPALQLWIVGGKRQPALRNLDEPNIKSFGFLSQEELQSAFDQSSLYAMPAFWEPWGLVYLEAMACKTPILGLNRNSIPELTGNGRFGFCVDSPTPEKVAESILVAFTDPAKLDRMGDEAQDHVLGNFTWDKVAEKILQRIDSLASLEVEACQLAQPMLPS